MFVFYVTYIHEFILCRVDPSPLWPFLSSFSPCRNILMSSTFSFINFPLRKLKKESIKGINGQVLLLHFSFFLHLPNGL